jgi:hypothetical protein
MVKGGLLLLAGILMIGTATTVLAGPFTGREARQQTRLNGGVESGEITPREYRRLEWEQGPIIADRQRAWADGYLSCGEVRHLNREQNRASRDIWRAKHN